MPLSITQDGEQRKRPILRYLRIVFSTVCGIVCLLLIALWVRSDFYSDEFRWSITDSRIMWLHSMLGQTSVSSIPSRGPAWRATIISERIERAVPTADFAFRRTRGAWSLSVPHWFLVLVLSALATAPWLRWRFSLRTLLIVMTLFAALLGIIAISK